MFGTELLLSYEAFCRGVTVNQEEVEEEVKNTSGGPGGF